MTFYRQKQNYKLLKTDPKESYFENKIDKPQPKPNLMVLLEENSKVRHSALFLRKYISMAATLTWRYILSCFGRQLTL
jgi:hypothetical protein